MYLLDTNIVSKLRQQKPHGAVIAWLNSITDNELFLSAVTLAEIQAGIELTRNQNPQRAEKLETWLDLVTDTYNILPMDGIVFRLWAKLMHRNSDTLYEDAMIAFYFLFPNSYLGTPSGNSISIIGMVSKWNF